MSQWISGHLIEIFGAVAGIVFVYLEIRQNIWLWPLGIVTSAVYIWVFYDSKFYADMGLQFYYLGISAFGWYWWLKGGTAGDTNLLSISRLSKSLIMRYVMVFIPLQLLIWFVLKHFTDSPIPAWDAFTTSVSIIATWMLARKILEHWILWIVADTVSICLYIYKGLFPTVILFSVYTLMAITGYQAWKRDFNMQIEKTNI
ncbi:MAG TPA: nicotinamide riboside transporter PnuC [Bacteroidales bacterium]|nr:nicotinamide riboside transporter PnuC [Bacteroidales bacterium]